MSAPTAAQRLLDLELPENDAGAATVRGYLAALLRDVWRYDEGFDGKRPFGNSGWKYDIYVPMIRAGLVPGVLDEHGYVEDLDHLGADEQILDAIEALAGVDPAPAGSVPPVDHPV